MERYNLWVTEGDHSRVICFGDRSEMNTIALLTQLPGDVHVLPDGDEPNNPIPPCEN